MYQSHARRRGAWVTFSTMLVAMFASLTAPVCAQDAEGPNTVAEAIKMEADDALPLTAFYATPKALAKAAPGALLRRQAFDGYALPRGATAVRILYRSQDAEGRAVATSAVVLIPDGPTPAGGWPVIAWAHGTSGVARQCAPSLMKDVYYGEEGLMPMVRAGYAVVATDYHGLGTAGPHQYVNKTAQAYDVINSIPAARAAVPQLGAKWVVDGHSQGGVAAWSVAEMQARLKDPNYLGAVSVAAAADLRGLLTQMSRPGGVSFYLDYFAYAIHARTPSFKPGGMLTGAALSRYGEVTTKGCWEYGYASFLGDTGGSRLRSGWDRTPGARRLFADNILGQAPIGGPMLVIGGEADKTVPIALLRAQVADACRRGGALTVHTYPGLDHDPTMDKSTPDQLTWIKARFAGEPSTGSCPAAGGASG